MEKIIVGLGNPGAKYKYNRHNLGFIILDKIVADLPKRWKIDEKIGSKVCTYDGVGFLKPDNFMNDSGAPVLKFLKYYKVTAENLYVIHDDLDLPFLTIKKQRGASSAGHNGVEDIIEKLGTKDFWRIRVGIGRPDNQKIDTSDWVLSNFSKKELEALNESTDEIKTLVF
jgi:PTH1 family peptidyl-tRNA hydrolase